MAYAPRVLAALGVTSGIGFFALSQAYRMAEASVVTPFGFPYLPWAALVGQGIVLNKDGSFQTTFKYRGPDLESSTEEELVSVMARVNNVLRRFGSGWALFFEAARISACDYPRSNWRDDAAWLVDEERRASFEEAGTHFESQYYLTFAYLPPSDQTKKTENLFCLF